MIQISYQEFFESYRDSLGDDGASELLKKAIAKSNLPFRESYTKEEALQICSALHTYEGFVGIIAGILASRIIIR